MIKEPPLEEHRQAEGHKTRRQVLGGNQVSLKPPQKLKRFSLEEQGGLQGTMTGLSSEG